MKMKPIIINPILARSHNVLIEISRVFLSKKFQNIIDEFIWLLALLNIPLDKLK